MRGLLIVNTGDGKGKTTAALGLAMRALGHGQKVLMVQFIKGNCVPGEIKTIESSLPGMQVVQTGLGFLPLGDPEGMVEHRQAALKGLALAEEAFESGAYSLVILDELNYAVSFGIVEPSEMLTLLKSRPSEMNVIVTGRKAHPNLAVPSEER